MQTAAITCHRCHREQTIVVPDGMTQLEAAEDEYLWGRFDTHLVCEDCMAELCRNGGQEKGVIRT